MQRLFLTILLAFIAVIYFSGSSISGPRIPADEMPLGVFNTYQYEDVTSAMLNSLHNDLGFNFAYISSCPWSGCDPIDSAEVQFYFDHGILPAFRPVKTNNTDFNIDYQEYEKSHYMKVEAEDRTSKVRFYYYNGSSSNGWFTPSYESDTPYVALDNLWYDTERHTWMDNTPIDFMPFVRIWADVDYPDLGDTLAVLNIFAGEDRDSLFYAEAIIVDSSIVNDTTIWDFYQTSYLFPDPDSVGNGSRITLQIIAYPEHEFKIDWLRPDKPTAYNNKMLRQVVVPDFVGGVTCRFKFDFRQVTPRYKRGYDLTEHENYREISRSDSE